MFQKAFSKTWILLIIAIIVIGGFLVYKKFFTEKVDCNKLKEQTLTLLEEANYCDVDSDCITEDGGLCPFPCYYLVNKNADLTKIDESMRKFSKDCFYCVYECMEAPSAEDIKCKDHKCDDTLYFKKLKLK